MSTPSFEDYGRLLLLEFRHYRKLKLHRVADIDPDLSVDTLPWLVEMLIPPADRTFFNMDIVWDHWIEILDNGSESDVLEFPRWIVEHSQDAVLNN
jgi:hypothetical protein